MMPTELETNEKKVNENRYQNPANVPIWKIKKETTNAVVTVIRHIVKAHLQLLLSCLTAAMAATHGVYNKVNAMNEQADSGVNVSCIRLVMPSWSENDEIPFHRTGKHRRVKFADLMQYKESRQRQSEEAMAELAAQAQELNMGY